MNFALSRCCSSLFGLPKAQIKQNKKGNSHLKKKKNKKYRLNPQTPSSKKQNHHRTDTDTDTDTNTKTNTHTNTNTRIHTKTHIRT
jgi:hypothetical protein